MKFDLCFYVYFIGTILVVPVIFKAIYFIYMLVTQKYIDEWDGYFKNVSKNQIVDEDDA